MDSLRIILIITGVCILASIYAWDRLQKRREAHKRDASSRYDAGEAGMVITGRPPGDEDYSSEFADLNSFLTRTHTDRPDAKGVDETPHTRPVIPAGEPKQPAGPDRSQRTIIMLHIVSAQDRGMHGESILNALQNLGFHFGDMNIFHHFGTGQLKTDRPLFSVVNMFEPGWFEIEQMHELTTRGISVFMLLPADHDAVAVFEYMLELCRRLANKLGAELRGPDRQPYSASVREAQLRQIRDHEQ